MSSTLYYTGVGSRETPMNIRGLMTSVALYLSETHRLRSGAADGADTSFERGAGGNADIYLPWKHFNGHHSRLCTVGPEALELAARFHPAWQHCRPPARNLHARNGYQVLGSDLATPSRFLLCWTSGGTGSGGTGQAIRIARAHDIPVFDMGLPEYVQPPVTSPFDAMTPHPQLRRDLHTFITQHM